MTATKCILCFVYFMVVFLAVDGQNTPLSPCPKVFKYENDGMQWYGIIKVPSPPPYGSEMKLIVSLSIGAKLPTNYSGNIELVGERGRILLNILRGLPITYKVNFPLLSPISKVTKIVFNGHVLCEGPAETIKKGINVVTSISLDHVLQTSDGANNTHEILDEPMHSDSRPNPDNFAKPRPTKPPNPNNIPQEYNPNDDNYDLQFTNELNHPIINESLRPSRPNQNNYENVPSQDTNNYEIENVDRPIYAESPQTRPKPSQSQPNQNDYNNQNTQDASYFGTESSNIPQYVEPQPSYGASQSQPNQPNYNNNVQIITKPGVQLRPTKPDNSQKPQHVNTVVSSKFDAYHDSVVGTSNVLPSPDILAQKPIVPPKNIIKPGEPLYNYHLTQDRNVSKTEVYHGTPENANLPYNYYYHEYNTSESVVNRFSYQYSHQHPGAVKLPQNSQQNMQYVPQNAQPMWKGSQSQSHDLTENQQQSRDVASPEY